MQSVGQLHICALKLLTARVVLAVVRLKLCVQERGGWGRRVEFRGAVDVGVRMVIPTIQRVVFVIWRLVVLPLVLGRHGAVTHCTTGRWLVVVPR